MKGAGGMGTLDLATNIAWTALLAVVALLLAEMGTGTVGAIAHFLTPLVLERDSATLRLETAATAGSGTGVTARMEMLAARRTVKGLGGHVTMALHLDLVLAPRNCPDYQPIALD